MEAIPEYTDLSDFISRTKIANNQFDNEAVIVMGWENANPILLPGFRTDIEKLDFEIYELGWAHWNLFLERLNWSKKDGHTKRL